MVVAIKCKSLLLKETLSIFLKEHLGTSDKCDVLISDRFIESKNKLFVISNKDSANLSLPFSKQTLLESLKLHIQKNSAPHNINIKEIDKKRNTHSLEKEIQEIMKEYTKKILLSIEKHKEH